MGVVRSSSVASVVRASGSSRSGTKGHDLALGLLKTWGVVANDNDSPLAIFEGRYENIVALKKMKPLSERVDANMWQV